MIKLFKTIYSLEDSPQRRVDVSYRLIMRMLDEDDTVKVIASMVTEIPLG